MRSDTAPQTRRDMLDALASVIVPVHKSLAESSSPSALSALHALASAAHSVLGYGRDASAVHRAVLDVDGSIHRAGQPGWVALEAISAAIEHAGQ